MTLDPVAALMLDEAGPLPERVLVVDDQEGALTRAVADAGADVRTWCDDLRDLEAVPGQFRIHAGLPTDWTPDLVLLRLPTSLSALDDYAENLSPYLAPSGRLIAGGRTKHMTPSQNKVLARHFGEVSASLGRQKSRVLRAAAPQEAPRRYPMRRYAPDAGLTIVAHGNVFNTNHLDDGTRLLLRTLGRVMGEPLDDPRPQPVGTALDVGCGSGAIAAWLAQRGWVTTGIDVSLSALASTQLTARANNTIVETRRAVGLGGQDDRSVDLIVTNPPFHRGARKDSSPTLDMIEDAGRVLRPGGELWVVFNSHLPYLPVMRRHVGITTIEAQDRHYVVARALRSLEE